MEKRFEEKLKERWRCDEVKPVGYGFWHWLNGWKYPQDKDKRFFAVRRGDRWSVLHGNEMISDYQWFGVDTDARLDDRHVIVRSENGCGIMSAQGELVIDAVYDSLSPYADPDDMWPYRDKKALLALRTDPDSGAQRMGLIDIGGRVIAPCVHPFTDVDAEDCLFCYWDGDGIGDSSDFSHRILNPLSTAVDPETFDIKYGLLNTLEDVYDGEPWQLFPAQWDECEYLTTAYIDEEEDRFSSGCLYARIEKTLFFLRVRDGDKWGIVDTAGRVITPCLWDEVNDDGSVRCGGETRYIDLWSGELVDEPVEWEVAWTFGLPPEIGTSEWRTTMIYYRVPGLPFS